MYDQYFKTQKSKHSLQHRHVLNLSRLQDIVFCVCATTKTAYKSIRLSRLSLTWLSMYVLHSCKT